MPAWFLEGMAELYASRIAGTEATLNRRQAARDVLQGHSIPLGELATAEEWQSGSLTLAAQMSTYGKAIAADLNEYMSMLFYTKEARDAFLARSASFVYRQKVNKAVWGDLQRFDLNPELSKFRFPTLVVTGRYDFNVAPSIAWAIHRAIPGSELAVFEKSGHLPFCEESDDFVSRVEAFLTKR